MFKIGIDYSLISPAVCVFDGIQYRFISFFDDYGKDWKNRKSKDFNYHRILDGYIEQHPYTRHIDKSTYRTEQTTKMESAKMISGTIINVLDKIVGSNDVSIGLEGFSYGSISSSTLDLALYNSFLRIKLMERFGDECLVIISPSEGKKHLSGKGNAKKDDMIKAFINNRLNDDILENNLFWQYCKSNDLDYKNIKPIDDLVDSYGILSSI